MCITNIELLLLLLVVAVVVHVLNSAHLYTGHWTVAVAKRRIGVAKVTSQAGRVLCAAALISPGDGRDDVAEREDDEEQEETAGQYDEQQLLLSEQS